jgi:protein SCO1/2
MRNTFLGIAAFISLVLGLLVASVMLPRPIDEQESQRLGFYLFDTPRLISDFSMTDHLGNTANLELLKGHWSLIFFGFTTCPDICPTTLSVLADAVRGIPDPPMIIMVSVDPERDTPEVLSQYVPAFDKTFIGITGSFDETVKLAEQLNVAFGKVPGYEPGSYLVDHSASLILINPEGKYAGFIKAPHNAQNIQRIVSSL